jgi:hypothetical protein
MIPIGGNYMAEKGDYQPEIPEAVDPVEDEAEKDDVVPFVSYDVTSYGSDPDVEGLVRRIKKEEIFIPLLKEIMYGGSLKRLNSLSPFSWPASPRYIS